MSVKLKPITETSWLVLGDTDDNRIGLLTEIQNQYVLMVKGEKKQFIDRKEVNKFFKEDVFGNVVESNPTTEIKKDKFINGYPVDFDDPHEVILKGNTLPLFTKKASSEVFYCAGFYCIKFPKNWMSAFTPKLATLQSYEYAGPYKTEMEANIALSSLRKTKPLE